MRGRRAAPRPAASLPGRGHPCRGVPHAPPRSVSREWPPGLPVPWGPLAVTAAVFLVVVLAFLPDTGGVCSTLAIIVLGYAAFSILATAIADFWRNVAPSRPHALEGRARLYRDVAERCLEAVERYPFAGDSLRREARYYRWKMRKEMRR